LAYTSVSEFGASPLFRSLAGQGRLFNPTFSLKLSPSGAEMYIGGANSQLYNGDITYTRVTVPVSQNGRSEWMLLILAFVYVQGYWQVSMDDVRVNGDKFFENQPAIFDTGANFICGDWDQVAELYKHLGGTLLVHAGFGLYHCEFRLCSVACFDRQP
jgi:cathepsin D